MAAFHFVTSRQAIKTFKALFVSSTYGYRILDQGMQVSTRSVEELNDRSNSRALKRQLSVWVAAPSDEVHSTQELLEVRQGSQGLGRLGEVGRIEVFSHSRTELKHIQRKEGDCLVS